MTAAERTHLEALLAELEIQADLLQGLVFLQEGTAKTAAAADLAATLRRADRVAERLARA